MPSLTTYQVLFPLAWLWTAVSLAQPSDPRHLNVSWTTDTTRKTVPLSEFTVVLPKGAFPALDFPAFIDRGEGEGKFFEHEPVIAVELAGQAKAYPLNLLTVHELSNDTLASTPILVTYCPLCNAGIVFDRRSPSGGKGEPGEFAVSGMLRRSDMVMYDKKTESWWQQLLGEALVGKRAGQKLSVIPSLIISVKEFFERYPQGVILSPTAGNYRAQRQYGRNPYPHYDDLENEPFPSFFPAAQLDHRLPPMERVVDIRAGERYKIYPFSVLARWGVINDQFEGKPVVLFYQNETISVLDEADIRESRKVGSVTAFRAVVNGQKLTFRKEGHRFVDEQTRSVWNVAGQATEGPLSGNTLLIEPHSNHLAFAWLAFHPESEIYQK